MNIDEVAWDDGYDCDRNKSPHMDTVIEEGEQDSEEDMIQRDPFPSAAAPEEEEEENNGDDGNGDDGGTDFVHTPQENINKLKVLELKE